MKTIQITLVLCFLLIGANIQAQFLDKLAKKAENAVERTVLNRTDREVSKKTDKTIDGVIEGDGKKDKKSKKTKSNKGETTKKSTTSIFGGSMEGLPDTYKFQYLMDMKITSNKDVSTLRYYVEPKASYFGYAMQQDNAKSVVVYDMENRAMITFMDNDGQKIAMKMRMPLDEEIQEMIKKSQNGEDNSGDTQNITPIAGKTILGYKCKGYLMKQDEGTSKVYVTNETPVSFLGMMASMQKNTNMANIPFDENTMVMEMEYTSNKRKKDNMHMICTNIEKQSFTIHKADYRGM